jgi:cysteine dioxygenase
MEVLSPLAVAAAGGAAATWKQPPAAHGDADADAAPGARCECASAAARDGGDTSPLSLGELVAAISEQLTCCKDMPLPKRLHLGRLLARLDARSNELGRFAHFDADKRYTRNLVATEDQTPASNGFTLMLLCWNPGKESPIHNHPCDGCWFRVMGGSVREVRYTQPPPGAASPALLLTGELVAATGAVSYMDDSLGLHKVGNPSADVPALTLHLYSPPFSMCRVWPDASDGTRSSHPVITYYSENGEVCVYECAGSGAGGGGGGGGGGAAPAASPRGADLLCAGVGGACSR